MTDMPVVVHHAPRFDQAEAARLAEQLFGVQGTLEPLPSERDQNFRITNPAGDACVLKIANGTETAEVLGSAEPGDRASGGTRQEPGAPSAGPGTDGRRDLPRRGPRRTSALRPDADVGSRRSARRGAAAQHGPASQSRAASGRHGFGACRLLTPRGTPGVRVGPLSHALGARRPAAASGIRRNATRSAGAWTVSTLRSRLASAICAAASSTTTGTITTCWCRCRLTPIAAWSARWISVTWCTRR